MASIHRLPYDILEMILLLFLPTSHAPSEMQQVLLLAAVSRQFRAAIISSPRFWTFVTIPIRCDEGQMKETLSFLETVLDRSRSLPLDVSWGTPSPSRSIGFDSYYCTKLLCLVLDKAPFTRWRSLKVNDEGWLESRGVIPRMKAHLTQWAVRVVESFLHGRNLGEARLQFTQLEEVTLYQPPPGFLKKRIEESARQLKRLVIWRYGDFPIDYPNSLKRITHLEQHDRLRFHLESIPQITHLHLEVLRFIGSPLLHLTHLTTEHLDLALFSSLMYAKAFPILAYLDAGIVEPTPGPAIFKMESLRHLVVKGLVSCIDAPNLDTLHIHCRNGRKLTAFCNSRPIPHYPLVPSKKLILEVQYGIHYVTEYLLYHNHNVRDLELQVFGMEADEYLIQALCRYSKLPTIDKPGKWRLCPTLSSLSIVLQRSHELDGPAWDRIAEGRKDGSLQKIDLNWTCGTKSIIQVNSNQNGQ